MCMVFDSRFCIIQSLYHKVSEMVPDTIVVIRCKTLRVCAVEYSSVATRSSQFMSTLQLYSHVVI